MVEEENTSQVIHFQVSGVFGTTLIHCFVNKLYSLVWVDILGLSSPLPYNC